MNAREVDDVTQEYEGFLRALGNRIKQLRNERGLTLRDMVVIHGYHDSQWRKFEREGTGGVQSLIRIAKVFQISLTCLLDGLIEDDPLKIEAESKKKAALNGPSKPKSPFRQDDDEAIRECPSPGAICARFRPFGL